MISFFIAEFTVIRPDPGMLVWTTIVFLIFWFLIGKFAFKPIGTALKDRENSIQNALDEAKRTREEMSKLKAENEQILAQAREERASILKEAKETKDSIISEAKNKAKDEAQKIVSNALMEIENQRKAAITDLKNTAGMLALDIAEKVLRKELSGDSAQQSYVKTLIDEIKLN